MVTRRQKTKYQENNDQVQIKLIRSQARGLWVTSSLAILISFISLLFSYFVFQNENKELCMLSIKPVNTDYLTQIVDGRVCCDSNGYETRNITLEIQYEAEIINLSKNPMTIISYYTVKESELLNNNIEAIDWKKICESDFHFQNNEQKLPHAIRLEPGEPYFFLYNVFIEIDPTTNDQIENDSSSFSLQNSKYLSELMFSFYSKGKDPFGNSINCTIEDRRITSYSMKFFDKKKGDPYYLILKTAKESFFSSKVEWYQKNDYSLPFIDIINDKI